MDQVAVVYNARAGAQGGDSSVADIAASFRRHGVTARMVPFDPETIGRTVRELLAGAPGLDALIVAGGDGTVRTVAAHLNESSVPLGVLPFGTMNALAHDLGVPDDRDAAIAALVAAPVHKIDVALANGQPFLCSSTLAMMPHLGRLRERVRDGLDRRTVPLIGRAVRLLWRYPRMPLTVVVDGTEHAVRARALVVSNNPLATSKPAHSRDRLDTGLLGVYIAQDRTNWDLLALTARMLDGSWQRDKRLLTYVGQRVEVDSPALALMSVMNDGEITQLELPLRYEIRPRALAMLAPRGTA